MLEVYCKFLKFDGWLFISNDDCPFRLEDGSPDWERFDPLLPDWVKGGALLDDGEYYDIAPEFIADVGDPLSRYRLEPLPPGVEAYDKDECYLYLRLYLPEPNKEV